MPAENAPASTQPAPDDAGADEALPDSLMRFAQSGDPKDHERLFARLSTESGLAAIEAPGAYEGLAENLRLADVLLALADNPAPSSDSLLTRLVQTPEFIGQWQRKDLLITALASLDEPSPDVIEFWQSNSEPGALHRNSVMYAVCSNASSGAAAVMAENLANTMHGESERIAWMRGPLLSNRNQLEILKASGKLLGETLEPPMRAHLVEALFDYQPRLWYRVDHPPQPPEPEAFSDVARASYRELAQLALEHSTMNDDLRARVTEIAGPNGAP